MLPYITLITSIIISLAAIYYSVSGLMQIFAGAAIAVMVMGVILEFSKLVAIIWLHSYWHRATWWLKTYLTTAVAILMFITSLGIFGGLSKAHIEQSTNARESVAQIERIDTEIARQRSIIERADEKIKQVETTGTGSDANLQQQIDREQARVDKAYERIQAAEEALSGRTEPLQAELNTVTSSLDALQQAITANDIIKVQGIVGVTPDGKFGSRTAESVDAFRAEQTNRRAQLTQEIQTIRDGDQSITIAQQQVKDGNELISRLRAQLGQGSAADIDSIVEEQQARIVAADSQLDLLTEEKFKTESEVRKLEAEVGPIKYVAEFIYGTADKSTLEEAVRWMIVVIIVVFDPLALFLLIASQYTFRYYKEDQPEPLPSVQINTIANIEDSVKKMFKLSETFDDYDKQHEDMIPDIIIETEDERIRADLYTRMDTDLTMKAHKQRWKEDHPNETIKEYKNAYIKGHIENLPWDKYAK